MNETPSLKTLQAQIGGMDCGNCARTIDASLSQQSEHPLAQAIVTEALAQGLELQTPKNFVDLSRRTMSIIQQNVVLSLVTKGLFLLLGTFGFMRLAVAVLADMGTSLLVTANRMRLFRAKTN